MSSAGPEFYAPDGASLDQALRRTRVMGIGAHADDLEILAFPGIRESVRAGRKSFFGVVVTDGRGSTRAGRMKGVSQDRLVELRKKEQKAAAKLGRYSGVAMLGYSSQEVKDGGLPAPRLEIKSLIEAGRPRVIYTHNLADKHDTHVAVALRTIEALRALPASARPEKLYGCEVWRDLDWLSDHEKIAFDVSGDDALAAALMRCFRSQNQGGKRYDLAAIARRRAHATFHRSHAADRGNALAFAMDLTPLIRTSNLDIKDFVRKRVERFSEEVLKPLERLAGR